MTDAANASAGGSAEARYLTPTHDCIVLTDIDRTAAVFATNDPAMPLASMLNKGATNLLVNSWFNDMDFSVAVQQSCPPDTDPALFASRAEAWTIQQPGVELQAETPARGATSAQPLDAAGRVSTNVRVSSVAVGPGRMLTREVATRNVQLFEHATSYDDPSLVVDTLPFSVALSPGSDDLMPALLPRLQDRPATGGCSICAGCGLCAFCVLCGTANFTVGVVGVIGTIGLIGLATDVPIQVITE